MANDMAKHHIFRFCNPMRLSRRADQSSMTVSRDLHRPYSASRDVVGLSDQFNIMNI